jgi:hypothetical protein
MNIGPGPIVVLSIGSGGTHQATRAGDTIGQFKLVSVSNDGLTFDWDGKQVYKTMEELTDHEHAQAVASQAAVDRNSTAAPPPPPPAALVGPGQDTAFGWKTCNMNDGLEPGTVKDGYRKTITTTPFGKNCTWDPVK